MQRPEDESEETYCSVNSMDFDSVLLKSPSWSRPLSPSSDGTQVQLLPIPYNIQSLGLKHD